MLHYHPIIFSLGVSLFQQWNRSSKLIRAEVAERQQNLCAGEPSRTGPPCKGPIPGSSELQPTPDVTSRSLRKPVELPRTFRPLRRLEHARREPRAAALAVPQPRSERADNSPRQTIVGSYTRCYHAFILLRSASVVQPSQNRIFSENWMSRGARAEVTRPKVESPMPVSR
jgi:hypothetical protein